MFNYRPGAITNKSAEASQLLRLLLTALVLCAPLPGTRLAAQAQTTNPDLVSFPSEEVAFIIGPQLRSGSAQNIAPWFDSNAAAKGVEHGEAFPATPPATDPDGYYVLSNYYDQALCQYINYYRTGDARFLAYARKITDSWWLALGAGQRFVENDPAPRNVSLGGLMLRAMDGRPEMWPWITWYVRTNFNIWVGARVTYDRLYYGVRDGGYMLLHAANLARVHPDQAVRNEFLTKSQDAAVNYYARVQRPDGSWMWSEDWNWNGVDDPGDGVAEQPFHVGLLLEGMVAVHRLTGNPSVLTSIVRSVENLYLNDFDKMGVPNYPGTQWRAFTYYRGDLNCPTIESCPRGAVGWDTNDIREARQLNSTVHHAFGYAYYATGDTRFVQWGDELFRSSFSSMDAYRDLADYRPKEYNQNYRSSGRYLVWRLGQGGTPPPPPPSPTPTPSPSPTPTPSPSATPTPPPSATPTPAPSPTPTPTQPQGQTRKKLKDTRRSAQNLINDLQTTTAIEPSGSTSLNTSTLTTSLNSVVAAIQQTYSQFGTERGLYTAAPRIEDALTKALDYASRAATSAAQQQFEEVMTNLRRAIDYLELADVRMTYGDVPNAVDYAQFFVRQHYVDFLGREPDEAGRAFWSGPIETCGADQHCAAVRRIDASAAFFLSIEFQETGYLVYRLYRGTLNRTVLRDQFLEDTRTIGAGVTVGAPGWVEKLAANKRAFYEAWVLRTDFRAFYGSLTNSQYVDRLFATTGIVPAPVERQALIADLSRGVSRSEVLARIIDGAAFRAREFNRAFVLMQYFGYLQRNPDSAGLEFWLQKLNDNRGDFRRAEMVRAFLDSIEYRERFSRL